MNSPRRPTIHSNANRAIGILLSAALFATIGFYATFPVGLHGSDLGGIVFDGGNIWVTDSNTGRVFRIRASDGAYLGQHKVGGEGAFGIASDGIHLWVTNFRSDTVVRLAGGDPTQFYPAGDFPTGVLFDGISIWVANFASDTVTKITLNQP